MAVEDRAALAYAMACGRRPDEAGLHAALLAAGQEDDDDYRPGDVFRSGKAVMVIRRVRGGENPACFYDGLAGGTGGGFYSGGEWPLRLREAWGEPIGRMRIQGALKLAFRKGSHESRLRDRLRWIAKIASAA